MRVNGRLISRGVMSAILAGLLSFLVPVFVDRRDFTKAVHEYTKNPTAENEATMERERAKNERVANVTHFEAAAVLFVLISVVWFVLLRRAEKARATHSL